MLSSDIHIKYFSLLVETSKHCCRKRIYVSRVWVWRKPFFCYFSASNCWYWAKNLIFFCKTFSRLFQAASYVSRGAMALEKHFVLELFLLSSDIHIKHFGLLVETSKHCCRKQTYVSTVWVWRKPFFCYFSASNWWYWAENFQCFVVKVLAGFSMLHPTCPEEQWLGKSTLSSNCFCYLRIFR